MAPPLRFKQIIQIPGSPRDEDALTVRSLAFQDSWSPPATISNLYIVAYAKLHLLGLPSEIRDQMWQAIFDEIVSTGGQAEWDQRPSTAYDELTLTCHQIHDEISLFWPRTIIQHRRITILTEPSFVNLMGFKRIALEIPLNQKYQFFLAAAAFLKRVAPALQDLRIFFVGTDRFQIPLTLKGCGNHQADISFLSERLAIDGQNHSERQPLFVALRYLSNLRFLVLTNHNYPLLPKMVLEQKSHLKQLHLVADARTTVEVLNISANASLNSLQLAGACTLNLKHLTWTVPDLSLQSAGGIRVNWYQDTANLLYILKTNSKQLQTLRMCFHEAIYGADSAAGTLVPAFRHCLEHLPLETLELHVNSQSPWFGREILQYLPNSLRRLFISRELLDEEHMTQEIDGRYMACPSSSDGKSASRFVRRLQGIAPDDYVHVGEDKYRNDFISLGGGKLGFIGYEYEPRKPTRFGNSELRTAKAEETRTWLLSLNGRLLDRERNSHLVGLDGAKHIPSRQTVSSDFPRLAAKKDTIAENYGPLWVYAPSSIREAEAAAKDLEDSIIVDKSDHYFGNEEGAAYVFQKEPSAHPDDLVERLWPDEVSADAGEHWQSDYKSGAQTEAAEQIGSERNRSRTDVATSSSDWGIERTAHWVRNWTWYSRENSYIIEKNREKCLAERPGPTLESLECGH